LLDILLKLQLNIIKTSDETGFIDQLLELPDEEVISLCTRTHSDCKDKKFEYEIQVNEIKKSEIKRDDTDNYKTFSCTIYVLARHGVSVISDIDDTVKISNVLSKRSLLKHTFYSYFKPVEGMSELYQKWYDQKCQFHYVSASPWQLYVMNISVKKYFMNVLDIRHFGVFWKNINFPWAL
jgi:hypothetical protein